MPERVRHQQCGEKPARRGDRSQRKPTRGNKDPGQPRTEVNPGSCDPEVHFSISQLELFYQLILAGPHACSAHTHVDSYHRDPVLLKPNRALGAPGHTTVLCPLDYRLPHDAPPTPQPVILFRALAGSGPLCLAKQ